MMLHRVRRTAGRNLWILVAKRVVAVRAVREDLLHAMRLESFQIAFRLIAKETLFAQPPGRVAGATLAAAEHAILDAQVVEDFDHGPRNRLTVGVEAARAADPIQEFNRLVGPGFGRTARTR